MKVSSIAIENFRSIENASLTFTDFNILIGQNNTGKTNFFEAVNWFYTGAGLAQDMKYQRDATREIMVSVEF